MPDLSRGRAVLAGVVSTLVAPARGLKRRELLLGLVVLATVFVYLPIRLSFGSRSHGNQDLGAFASPPPLARLSEVDPQGELVLPTPPYRTFPGGPGGGKRNPFGFGTPPTPPPPPPPPPTPPPTPRPPTPTPTPTYDSPFTLLGFAEEPGRGRRIAWLKAGEDVFVVLEGDTIEVKGQDGRKSRHRVKKIGIESVQLESADFAGPVDTVTFPKAP